MNRYKFLCVLAGVLFCGFGPVQAQEGTMTQVAAFRPDKLGEQGWTKLHDLLTTNHVVHHADTDPFHSERKILYVKPEQIDLAHKLITELRKKENLCILLNDDFTQ